MLLLAGLTVLVGGCGEPPAPPPPAPSAVSELPMGYDTPVPPVEKGTAPHARLMLIKGCVMCERIDAMTADLEKQYGASLRADRHDSESPSGRAYLRSVGMRRHGVVLYDAAGKVAWRNDSHALDRETLASAIASVAKGETPTAPQRTSKWQTPDLTCPDHASGSASPVASPVPAPPTVP